MAITVVTKIIFTIWKILHPNQFAWLYVTHISIFLETMINSSLQLKLWHLRLREGIICAKSGKFLKVTFSLKYEQMRSLNVFLDKCKLNPFSHSVYMN